jgi:LruC domain-containing protein
MKDLKNIILVLLALTTTFNSCTIPDVESTAETDSVIKSINDFRVPNNFNWKTTQSLNVSVTLPDDGEIHPLIITNPLSTKSYFRGYPDDKSRTVNTKITIPSYIKELRLIYNGVDGQNIATINNGLLSYNFSSRNQSGKSSQVAQIDLGSIEDFAIYSISGAVSNVGVSDVTGDVGTNLGAISGFGSPSIFDGTIEITNSITSQAALDLNNLIIQLNNSVTTNSTHAPAFGSETLTPGVYSITGASSILGNLTLDAQGDTEAQFIFKIGGAFTTGASATMILINGASVNNIFWIATGAVTMAASTTVSGSFIANPGAASMGTGSELNGRLLSASGAISLLNNVVYIPQSNIEISSICINPDAIFTITNIGDHMTTPLVYTLFKSGVQVISEPYQLNLNQSINVTSVGTIDDDLKLVVETSYQGNLEEIIQGCADNPTEQYSGTVAFEDIWPGTGDFDLNDMVIGYDFNIVKNNQEVVQSMTATFTIKAYGASFHNGFGFTLPSVTPSDVISVSGNNIINNSVFSTASNGLESGQSKATVIVFDDAYRIMPTVTSGTGANTQLEHGYTEPISVVVEIVFANDAITFSELNIGAFNPFLIVQTTVNGAPGSRGKEVHLPNYEPSDLFDTSYFGQSNDYSSAAEGRYFVTNNNLPSAIDIAGEFDWAIEYQSILGAYNMFQDWAQSGGTIYQDWYLDTPNYRNNSLIYN